VGSGRGDCETTNESTSDFGPAASPLQKLLQYAGFLVNRRSVSLLQAGALVPADVVCGESVEPGCVAEELTQGADIHHVVAVGAPGKKILSRLEPHRAASLTRAVWACSVEQREKGHQYSEASHRLLQDA